MRYKVSPLFWVLSMRGQTLYCWGFLFKYGFLHSWIICNVALILLYMACDSKLSFHIWTTDFPISCALYTMEFWSQPKDGCDLFLVFIPVLFWFFCTWQMYYLANKNQLNTDNHITKRDRTAQKPKRSKTTVMSKLRLDEISAFPIWQDTPRIILLTSY